MKAKDFDELVTSVREAGKIRRGVKAPSRRLEFRPAEVREIRARLGSSQPEFAFLIGISVDTLQMKCSVPELAGTT